MAREVGRLDLRERVVHRGVEPVAVDALLIHAPQPELVARLVEDASQAGARFRSGRDDEVAREIRDVGTRHFAL